MPSEPAALDGTPAMTTLATFQQDVLAPAVNESLEDRYPGRLRPLSTTPAYPTPDGA